MVLSVGKAHCRPESTICLTKSPTEGDRRRMGTGGPCSSGRAAGGWGANLIVSKYVWRQSRAERSEVGGTPTLQAAQEWARRVLWKPCAAAEVRKARPDDQRRTSVRVGLRCVVERSHIERSLEISPRGIEASPGKLGASPEGGFSASDAPVPVLVLAVGLHEKRKTHFMAGVRLGLLVRVRVGLLCWLVVSTAIASAAEPNKPSLRIVNALRRWAQAEVDKSSAMGWRGTLVIPPQPPPLELYGRAPPRMELLTFVLGLVSGTCVGNYLDVLTLRWQRTSGQGTAREEAEEIADSEAATDLDELATATLATLLGLVRCLRHLRLRATEPAVGDYVVEQPAVATTADDGPSDGGMIRSSDPSDDEVRSDGEAWPTAGGGVDDVPAIVQPSVLRSARDVRLLATVLPCLCARGPSRWRERPRGGSPWRPGRGWRRCWRQCTPRALARAPPSPGN